MLGIMSMLMKKVTNIVGFSSPGGIVYLLALLILFNFVTEPNLGPLGGLLTPDGGEGKCIIYCRAPRKEGVQGI